MWAVSTLWDEIVSGDYWYETKADIAGVSYQSEIVSISVSNRMFSDQTPGVGGCIAGELSMALLTSNSIPRMAMIRPYVRVTNGTNVSEWLPQGVFFVDTRNVTHNDDDLSLVSIHAYDAMLKTEADYPNTTHPWPVSDIDVVREIASTLGVGVDSRTEELMSKAYQIGLPAGYSMREVLSNLASMYAGNWILNYDGDLLLIAVNGIPPETNYLINATYDAITFGGDRILV